MRQIRSVLVAGALLGAVTPPGPAGAAGCARVQSRGGGWATVTVTPGSPARQAADLAVAPGSSRRLFVVSRDRLFRSRDGGCSWSLVYTAPAAADGSLQEIRQVVVPSKRPRVYLLTGADAVPPTVLRSDDDGGTFTAAGPVPSRLTGAVVLRAAPTDADTVYLADELSRARRLYFRSRDAGASWEPMAAAPPSAADLLADDPQGRADEVLADRNFDVVVDPTDPDVLWEWRRGYAADAGLRTSATGGRSWTQVTGYLGVEPTREVYDVAIARQSGRPAQIAVLLGPAPRRGPAVSWSTDGGLRWYERALPQGVSGLAVELADRGRAIVVHDRTDGVLSFRLADRRAAWRALTPAYPHLANVADFATVLVGVDGSPATLYVLGIGGTRLERYTGRF